MTKTSGIVSLLLALLLASAPCVQATGEAPPAVYPTTSSPNFSMPNPGTPWSPGAPQAPDRAYIARSQAGYGSYLPTGERQVACYAAPSAAPVSGTGDCACQSNPYAVQEYQCPTASCMPCAAPQAVWFASVGGLLMSIDEGDHYFFSYDDFDESQQYTDWRSVNIEWGGGFEVRVRRIAPCSCSGLELAYWGLFPDAQVAAVYGTDVVGNLNGIHNWDQLDYNGDTADTWVNNAAVHRLRRDVEIHNVEANDVMLLGDACCSPWRAELLCGVRAFHFADDLQFAADTVDTTFTYADEEIYYDIDTENTLVGAQVGGWGQYNLGCRVSVAAGAKAGVYNNHINAFSRIGGAAGTATINNGPNDTRPFRVDASKDDVAMLGELQLELLCQITPTWLAGLGYRAVGVTGVALPTDQIYPDLRGLQDVELVDSHGSLFLHGFSARVEHQF